MGWSLLDKPHVTASEAQMTQRALSSNLPDLQDPSLSGRARRSRKIYNLQAIGSFSRVLNILIKMIDY